MPIILPILLIVPAAGRELSIARKRPQPCVFPAYVGSGGSIGLREKVTILDLGVFRPFIHD